jgi:hypothetical protein
MSQTLPRQRIRVALDPLSHDGLSCILQGRAPILWRGTDAYIECGFFTDGVFVDSLTGIVSATLDILSYSDRDGSPLVTKTVLAADFGTTLTSEQWTSAAADKYHARFALDRTDTQFDMTDAVDHVLNLWLVVHALMSGGEYITLGAGQIQVEEDGAQNGLSVINAAAPAFRILDGEIQLWDPAEEKYRTLMIDAGALALGPGEE